MTTVPAIACAAAPTLPLDWVVTGQTGLRGTPVAGTCPLLAVTAAQSTIDALSSCQPIPPSLHVANVLYDDATTLDRSYALYRNLAQLPALHGVALFRAGRAALRLGRSADAMAAFGALLGGGPLQAALRDITLRIVSIALLANDDLDGDGTRDAEFPEARFAAPFLPEAPWAPEAAIAAVRVLVEQARTDDATRARAAISARWPDMAAAASAAVQLPDHADGTLDASAIPRVVTSASLLPCAPDSPTVLAVRFTVALDGSIDEANVSPPGATADCVAAIFTAAHVPPPDGGTASLDGVVIFP